MEISQISNKKEVNNYILDVLANMTLILFETEKDIYTYFQGVKEIQDQQKEIVCPHCEKSFDFDNTEVIKTMDDWEQEDRSSPNSMAFDDMNHYVNTDLLKQILQLIDLVKTKPTDMDQQIDELKPMVRTLTTISTIYAQVCRDIKSAPTQKDIDNIKTKALIDIQQAIVNTVK